MRGTCPRPASKAPVENWDQEGTYVRGCHALKEGSVSSPPIHRDKTSPRMKINNAYGTRGIFWVKSNATNAKSAHTRLSPQFGLNQPSGCKRELPADNTSDSPAPTWMPFTTGVGITRVNHLSIPVALNTKTIPAVVKPAEMVSSMENFRAMATAAMAYRNVRSVMQ